MENCALGPEKGLDAGGLWALPIHAVERPTSVLCSHFSRTFHNIFDWSFHFSFFLKFYLFFKLKDNCLVSAKHHMNQPWVYICPLPPEPNFHFLILFLPLGITQSIPFCPNIHSFIQFMLNAYSRAAFELYAEGKERSHCISYTLRHLDQRPCLNLGVWEAGQVQPLGKEGELGC